MIIVHYDAETTLVLSAYGDTASYVSAGTPSPVIDVTEDQWNATVGMTQKVVDGVLTGEPIPEKVYVRRMKQMKIATYLMEKRSGDTSAWLELIASLKANGMYEVFLGADYIEEDEASFMALLPIFTPIMTGYSFTLEDMLTACNDPWWQMQNPIEKKGV